MTLLIVARDLLQDEYDALSPWDQLLSGVGDALLVAIDHLNRRICDQPQFDLAP